MPPRDSEQTFSFAAVTDFISVLNLYGLFLEMGSSAIVYQSEHHLTSSVFSDLPRARKMQTRSDDSGKQKKCQTRFQMTKILDEYMQRLKHGFQMWRLNFLRVHCKLPPSFLYQEKKTTKNKKPRAKQQQEKFTDPSKITRFFFFKKKHSFIVFKRLTHNAGGKKQSQALCLSYSYIYVKMNHSYHPTYQAVPESPNDTPRSIYQEDKVEYRIVLTGLQDSL